MLSTALDTHGSLVPAGAGVTSIALEGVSAAVDICAGVDISASAAPAAVSPAAGAAASGVPDTAPLPLAVVSSPVLETASPVLETASPVLETASPVPVPVSADVRVSAGPERTLPLAPEGVSAVSDGAVELSGAAGPDAVPVGPEVAVPVSLSVAPEVVFETAPDSAVPAVSDAALEASDAP